ncbi:hypothetical protein BC826DRAFT_976358 [Russula brevipes]|nr:hypothetical protein BC826DRAFT_976473 [Russula brevipes]KAI0278310.1 hypothetical protein BC826DRAFT_976358 [Russula brevipes]
MTMPPLQQPSHGSPLAMASCQTATLPRQSYNNDPHAMATCLGRPSSQCLVTLPAPSTQATGGGPQSQLALHMALTMHGGASTASLSDSKSPQTTGALKMGGVASTVRWLDSRFPIPTPLSLTIVWGCMRQSGRNATPIPSHSQTRRGSADCAGMISHWFRVVTSDLTTLSREQGHVTLTLPKDSFKWLTSRGEQSRELEMCKGATSV